MLPDMKLTTFSLDRGVWSAEKNKKERGEEEGKGAILTSPNDYTHFETQERHVNPNTPSDHTSSPSPRIGESTCQPNPISFGVKKRRKREGVVKVRPKRLAHVKK
jgi:hypothetical protein